jgi:hypothetical protein
MLYVRKHSWLCALACSGVSCTVHPASAVRVHVLTLVHAISLQGLDVKRHNYDSWMGPLLHTAVNVTVTDFE